MCPAIRTEKIEKSLYDSGVCLFSCVGSYESLYDRKFDRLQLATFREIFQLN